MCKCTDDFKCFECLRIEAEQDYLDELWLDYTHLQTQNVIKLNLTPEQKRKQFKLINGGKNDRT